MSHSTLSDMTGECDSKARAESEPVGRAIPVHTAQVFQQGPRREGGKVAVDEIEGKELVL